MMALATACGSQPTPKSTTTAYVRGSEEPLRDQLGPSSRPIATLQSGERVEVLARRPRWAQVRTRTGQVGWVHAPSLVSQETFDQFQRLAQEAASLPSQGKAIARREANLHLESSRDSEMFHRLREGEAVEVVAHRVAERILSGDRRPPAPPLDVELPVEGSAQVEVQRLEDWLLVRDSGSRIGWVLESSLDMDVPFEVAQYSEGLRIRAWFVLHVEEAQTGNHPWYLWATIRSRSGLPYDYDEIRVFVWNPRQSRYETSYRERNLVGFYPIQIGTQETGSGPSPTFTLPLEDETGRRFQKNYRMVGRLVRPQS